MFVFEDLLLIDPLGLKEVVGKVERKVLTVALKGTSEQLRNHMSPACRSAAPKCCSKIWKRWGR